MTNQIERLQQIAIRLVAETQPTSAVNVISRLKREAGASHHEANSTVLRLIRDGRVKRTFLGKLILPGAKTGGPKTGELILYIVVIGGILTFMAWVFSQMF